MIELTNIEHNVILKCDIVGYEFPDSPGDNWCLLRVEVRQGNKSFERIDPALETTELLDLCEWFRCLSESRLPRYSRLTFTEPCISFEFLACKDDQVRISVELSHELKPDFELEQFQSKHSEWTIVFELNSKDFEKTLTGIKEAINQYPMREKSEEEE